MWVDLHYASGRCVFTDIGSHTFLPRIWKVAVRRKLPLILSGRIIVDIASISPYDIVEFELTPLRSYGLPVYRQKEL